MGYIEETGAAQHFRDSRITTIYEGTTGIQANDLIGRKIARDGGAAAAAVLAQMSDVASSAAGAADESLKLIGRSLSEGIDALNESVDYVVANFRDDMRSTSVGAVPLLKLFGIVTGGWLMAREALAAQAGIGAASGAEAAFLQNKLVTARFYAEHVLTQADGLARTIRSGADSALALADDAF